LYFNVTLKQQKAISKIEHAPKNLDKFIINFDNSEFDILSGSFCLNLIEV